MSGEQATGAIVLDARVDVSGVRALHARLAEALATETPLAIDLSRVERIDTCALQTLRAFERTAAARGITVRFALAAGVAATARRLGLQGALAQDPEPDTGEDHGERTDRG